MRIHYRTIAIGFLSVFSMYLAHADDFERTERRNFWNASHNMAGIRMDSVSISTARLFGNYGQGGFRDTYMAESSWTAGASAKTIMHLDRFSMNGAFSFENFSGTGMTGSMSSRPGYYPVDVLEFTPGNKTMQTYSVQGGISIDLNDCFTIGAGLDYLSRNYTKRKDLRHTTWLLDMTADIGLIARLGPKMSLGVSYFFNKSSETINAEELGISSESYYAFLDKGMMFGAYDIWSGGATHLKESGISGFPVRENLHGIALQIDGAGFYGELEYAFGRGKAGEKEVTWFDFPSDRLSARFGYKFKPGQVEHFIRADASVKYLQNNENVIVKETTGGVTTNVTYGSNRIFSQAVISGGLSYEAVAPGWEFHVGASADNTSEMSSQIYPYIYTDALFAGQAFAGGLVRIWKFDLGVELCYGQGVLTTAERMSEGGLESDTKPYRMSDWYDMQKEYRTAPRIDSELSLRFNFWKGLYVEAEAMYTRAFNLKYITGNDRICGVFSFGYTF